MDEIAKQVEEFAELQFTDAEIATICQIDASKYRDCIDRGRLKAEAEVRRMTLELAKKGDTASRKVFMELNKNAKKRQLGS